MKIYKVQIGIFVLMFSNIFIFLPLITNAQNLSIAIMPLQSSILSKNEAITLTVRLNSELIKIGKYDVIEEAKVRRILKQQELNEADGSTIEDFIEIGKSLGVQHIIAGYVGLIGQTFTLEFKKIIVSSEEIAQIIIHNFEGRSDELLGLMEQVAMELSGIDPDKNEFNGSRAIQYPRQRNIPSIGQVKYHVGGSFFYALTRSDDYIPLGLRFCYHLKHVTLGAYLGRVVDYGYDFVDDRYSSVDLLFHKMTFAEISCDYHLTNKKPVTAFVGMAIAYTNPIRSEWSQKQEPPWDSVYHRKRKNKIGIHPQIGLYLRRDYAISSRIVIGLAYFSPEPEGLNNSGITIETSLLLSL